MRYASVDILRGLTVAVMILVNNPGSWSHVYPWLLHAEWHGCLLADLVFPFFLFIVGLSIVFSLNKALVSGADKQGLALKCLKRSLILIGLGLFLNLFPDFDFSSLRFPGVLQRIGIVFAIGSLLFIYLSEKQRRWISAFILIAYWILLSFIPVPDTGIASLEKNMNWASWLDQLLLEGHMWKYTYTWDPEGVMSTIPAIVSVLMGISTAVYMQKHSAPVKGLFLYGLVALAIGWSWSFHLPFNKALWTSSFVLFTTGIALCLLSISVYLFDQKKINRGTIIFRALGANPLAAYFGAELLVRILNLVYIGETPFYDFIFNQLSNSVPNNLSSLIMALAMVGLWVIIALTLYKRKIYIKV